MPFLFKVASEGDSQIADIPVDSIKQANKYLNQFIDWIIAKGSNILLAIVVLYLGGKLIKLITKLLKKSFAKSEKLTREVESFLLSLIKILLYAVLIITVAALVGFQVTSLITILGSAGIAIGLALQGSLSNLAGGVLILVTKPFVIGDYILENGTNLEGTVSKIEIFYTTLITPDNKTVVIPNGGLSSAAITNMSSQKNRRVDILISVEYSADIKLVKETLAKCAKNSKYIVKGEPIDIFVNEFKDSSIEMGLRFWVHTSNYRVAKWEANEAVINMFREHNITIPFNQLEVSVKNNIE